LTDRNYYLCIICIIVFFLTVTGSLLATLATNGVDIVQARTEEVLDTANNNLKISMQAPDDWNSGRLSATILNVNWKLNGIFATNFATKLFGSSEEPAAYFAIVNSPSLANAAIPLAQKLGLISFALSQYVTINSESDVTLSDGSSGHLYSISVSLDQLRKLKAPIDKAHDVTLITTEQHGHTYIILYATEFGKMGQYQSVFDKILNSVTIGTASFSGSANSPSVTANANPISSPNTDMPPSGANVLIDPM
jgi:cytochrome c biogenesis factor